MSGKFSRDKGKRNEREIVKILNDWWGDSAFKRKVRQTEGDSDIETPDHFPYEIEVKAHKNFDFIQIFHEKSSFFSQWWKQTVKQAEAHRKKPLLFFKVERKGWFVVLNVEDAFENKMREFVILYQHKIVIATIKVFTETEPAFWET